MVYCGKKRCGEEASGVAWFGMAWLGKVRCGEVRNLWRVVLLPWPFLIQIVKYYLPHRRKAELEASERLSTTAQRLLRFTSSYFLDLLKEINLCLKARVFHIK